MLKQVNTEPVPDYLNALVNLKRFLEENPFVSGVVQNLSNNVSEIQFTTISDSSPKAFVMGACLLKIQYEERF
jgi:hypothetical protein